MLSQINNSRFIKTAVVILLLVVSGVAAGIIYGAVHTPSEPAGTTCTVSSAAGAVSVDCTED